MLRMRIIGFITALIVILGLLLGFGIATSDRSGSLTIASGPRGGPSWQVAEELRLALEDIGYEVTVIPNEATRTLIDQVDDPDDPVDITFLYERIDPRAYPNVTSLGTIGKRPIFFAVTDRGSPIRSIADMKGSRISIGPVNSALANLVTSVLAAYGITDANSNLVNMPSKTTVSEYRRLGFDVVTERYGDSQPLFEALVQDQGLRFVEIEENRAVAGFVPSAQAMTIPRGALSLVPIVPTADLPTVGQLLTVVTRANLSTAAAYAIAQSLTYAFGDSSMFASAGEYPNFSDRQLPINVAASDFYRTGQVPWQYQHLPPLLADSLLQLLIPLSLLILFSSLYSIFLPELYSLWTGVLKPRSEERLVAAMEARLAQGKELTVRQRQRLSAILTQQDAGRAIRQRVDSLRTELSEPVGEQESDEGRDSGS